MFKKFLMIFCVTLVFFGCPAEPEKKEEPATQEDIQAYETGADAVSDALEDAEIGSSLKLKSHYNLKGIKGLAKGGNIFAIPKDITLLTTNFSTNVSGVEGSFSVNATQSLFYDGSNPPIYLGITMLLNANFSDYRRTDTSPKLTGSYKEDATMKMYPKWIGTNEQITNITYTARSQADLRVNDKNVKWDINISLIMKITYGQTTNAELIFNESGSINDRTYSYSTNVTLSNITIAPIEPIEP